MLPYIYVQTDIDSDIDSHVTGLPMLVSQTSKKRRKATETSFARIISRPCFPNSLATGRMSVLKVAVRTPYSLLVRDTHRDPLTIETKTYRLLPPKLVLSI